MARTDIESNSDRSNVRYMEQTGSISVDNNSVVNIAVVGYGYWGPNLVRNFAEAPGLNLVAVADLDPAKLEVVSKRYPAARTTTRYEDLLADPLGDTRPSPRAAYVAVEAMVRGKEFCNVNSQAAVLAFQQCGNGFDFIRSWRDVFLLVPHDTVPDCDQLI